MDYTPEQLNEWAVATERMHGETLTVEWRLKMADQLRAHAAKIEECERLHNALTLVMAYPEIRQHIGSQLSGIADAALAKLREGT